MVFAVEKERGITYGEEDDWKGAIQMFILNYS